MLEAIESRLNTQFTVKTALDFAAIGKKPIVKSPTMFVIPLGYRTQKGQRTTGPAIVTKDDVVGIVTAVRGINDALGGSANEAIAQHLQTVSDLLFGWPPGDAYEPLMPGNGRLLMFKDKTMYWLDEFYTSHYEEAKQ